jgi:hypothetical protein
VSDSAPVDIQRARFAQIDISLAATDEALVALVPPQSIYAIVDGVLTAEQNKQRAVHVEVAAERHGDVLRVTVIAGQLQAGDLVIPYQTAEGAAA